MGKRKNIGLVYEYDENWIGGTYYVENLISALSTLPDDLKPAITILSSKKDYFNVLKSKNSYPFLRYEPLAISNNYIFRIINKISRIIFKKNIITKTVTSVDFVFPFPYDFFDSLKSIKYKIFWIPDFQDYFIPGLFTSEELNYRKRMQNEIAYHQKYVVLSSENSKKHLQDIFPDYIVKAFIVPFAVTHPAYEHISITNLLEKYNLPDNYFMSPNQFWKHKNHVAIIEAIKLLKDIHGIELHVIFSGKPNDYRNPGYYDTLLHKVSSYFLEDQISFLGFIDRKEQLKLMRNAKAIIQPSLFEGWSTVVEDAKAMNKIVIASNIPVHIEQLQGSNAKFFDADNYTMLMNILKEVNDGGGTQLYNNLDYESKIKLFGQKLIDVFDYIE